MSKDKDVEAMIAAAKAGGALPNDKGVPILNQRPPIMHGIPVNGGLLTIDAVEKMSERAFRELFLGVIVNLLGGVYVPPRPPAQQPTESTGSNADTVVNTDKEPTEDGETAETAVDVDDSDPED